MKARTPSDRPLPLGFAPAHMACRINDLVMRGSIAPQPASARAAGFAQMAAKSQRRQALARTASRASHGARVD
jgi:hypothetical protein